MATQLVYRICGNVAPLPFSFCASPLIGPLTKPLPGMGAAVAAMVAAIVACAAVAGAPTLPNATIAAAAIAAALSNNVLKFAIWGFSFSVQDKTNFDEPKRASFT